MTYYGSGFESLHWSESNRSQRAKNAAQPSLQLPLQHRFDPHSPVVSDAVATIFDDQFKSLDSRYVHFQLTQSAVRDQRTTEKFLVVAANDKHDGTFMTILKSITALERLPVIAEVEHVGRRGMSVESRHKKSAADCEESIFRHRAALCGTPTGFGGNKSCPSKINPCNIRRLGEQIN